MTRIIKKPNLPENPVTTVLLGEKYKKTASELEKLGIESLFTTCSTFVRRGLEYHADMQFSGLDENKALLSRDQKELYNKLQAIGFDEIEFIEKDLEEKYPGDVLLNFVIINNAVIYNPDTVSCLLKDFIKNKSLKEIKTKQGYTKCSVGIVSDEAIITEDISIGSKAEEIGIDVLLIDKGFVKLEGYDYGFIGGACGKISKDILLFNGKIENHPDFDNIKSFLLNHGVYPYSLNDGELEDIGSIIPIRERV